MYELFQAILNSGEKADLRQLLCELRSKESDISCGMRFCKLLEITATNPKSQPTLPLFLPRQLITLHEILLKRALGSLSDPGLLVKCGNSGQTWLAWADDTPLLDVRDASVNRYQTRILEIDLGPFYEPFTYHQRPQKHWSRLRVPQPIPVQPTVDWPEHWLEKLFDALQDGIRRQTPQCHAFSQPLSYPSKSSKF